MKGFKILLNGNNSIKIDADEIPKFIKALQSSSSALFRQGMFNPSYYIALVEDKDRESTREVDALGHHTGKIKYELLPDIFEGVKELAELKSAEVKRLN